MEGGIRASGNSQCSGVYLTSIYFKGLKKKPPITPESGKQLYNRYCYFCHGYSGDAKTIAANYLQPPPANLQTLPKSKQSISFLRQTILFGRPGTAMMGFQGSLNETQLAALIAYLQDVIFQRQASSLYHSAENGWPNHQQYVAAFPFVFGTLSMTVPVEQLSPEQQRGRFLYSQRCIVCHEQKNEQPVTLEPYAVSLPRSASMQKSKPEEKNADGELQVDVISSATPYAQHEQEPKAADLTPLEKKGQGLFQANCAFCHAPDGSGRNWIGSFIQPRPRNFNDAQQMQKFDRQKLQTAIKNGVEGTAMPAWQTVMNDEQIDAIIAYIGRVFYPPLNQQR